MNQGQFLSIYREMQEIKTLLQQLVDAQRAPLTLGLGALTPEEVEQLKANVVANPRSEIAQVKGRKRGTELPE